MKDRFRQKRICPDFYVLRIRRPHVMFGRTPLFPSLVEISKSAQHAALKTFLFGRQIGKTTAIMQALKCRPSPFVPDDDHYRKEFCCTFTEVEPKPDCPKCTEGNLTMATNGRGWVCRSCGYKSWECGPVYVGVDTSKGKDYTAAVFSHREGPVMVVDKVVTYKAAPEATP